MQRERRNDVSAAQWDSWCRIWRRLLTPIDDDQRNDAGVIQTPAPVERTPLLGTNGPADSTPVDHAA